MINDLRGSEYDIIEAMGYTIYDEIGRKQSGDGTWSKVIKENGVFIMTGTKYSGENFDKKEFREVYNSAEDFKNGSINKEA
jgi:hypothetical protein